MKIYFVTTNKYKFEKFTQAVMIPGVDIVQLAEETAEIQAEDNSHVAAFSASSMAQKYNLPVLKEDVGLYIESLRGFPGPYLNQIEKWIKTAGFLKLLEDTEDRSAYWEYAISFCNPGESAQTFVTKPPGTIATEARGKGGWFADKLFIPHGQEKTIAELLDDDAYIRNEDHYKQMQEFLTTKFAS